MSDLVILFRATLLEQHEIDLDFVFKESTIYFGVCR